MNAQVHSTSVLLSEGRVVIRFDKALKEMTRTGYYQVFVDKISIGTQNLHQHVTLIRQL